MRLPSAQYSRQLGALQLPRHPALRDVRIHLKTYRCQDPPYVRVAVTYIERN